MARLNHYPFVPTIRPATLEGILPELVALAARTDATFGDSGRPVDAKFWSDGELSDPEPESASKTRDKIFQ